MKGTLLGCVALVIIAILVGLLQLWSGLWTPAVFIKLEITLGALFALLLTVWFARKEYSDYQRQQQGHDRLDN